ncbi:MAG TPA: hypothetical protein VLG12_06175 [Candidatus Saccharimonadales bacterium]|nr:hypothetical protein [Candidatus Saccharimonadales bacterium]
MKVINWIDKNGLLVLTLILLAFIPLYPKIPLVSLTYSWVSIRWDDVLVSFTVLVYFVQLFRGKATWKTPVSKAVFSYWIIGFIATLLGVLFIFPHLPLQFTSFPSVYIRNAALFFFRHIEYMLLLFVAYSSITDKKQLQYVITILLITITLIILYGFGQRFIPYYFPAFSTMNEEFAKGQMLFLNATDRLQSTFAGHYDFAAYLVMMIPLLGALIFGYKNWKMKLFLFILAFMGVLALLWTASRTSFGVYFVAITCMLVLQKQKKWIIPVIVVSAALLFSFQNIWIRYASTVKPVNAVYDKQGHFIGFATDEGNNKYKIITTQPVGPLTQPGTVAIKKDKPQVGTIIAQPTPKAGTTTGQTATTAGQVKTGEYTIEKQQTLDISATTRLQTEWPNAIKAWLRDPLFGSGFSSVGLATDGNYFRILAETGILGIIAFLAIFFFYAKYVFIQLKHIESPVVRSFVVGVSAGILGIGLNAVLIDVFEASKIAYTLWLLMGVVLSTLHCSTNKK